MSLKRVAATVVAAGTVLAGSTIQSAAPADAASCAKVTWATSAKSAGSSNPLDAITGVRAGRHPCYDRLVVDISDRSPKTGYVVKYVSNVYTEAQGLLVPLRGGAKLHVEMTAPAYNIYGKTTWKPVKRTEVVNVTGYSAFRQVAYLGSFEGYASFGVGVRIKLPFRVFILQGPGNTQRLVIDVAH